MTKLVAKAISVGRGHTCALLGDATVRCWGENAYGQLGDATATTRCSGGILCSRVPAAAPNLAGATAIATGNSDTCALLDGGTVQCWGCNTSGRLGNGSTTLESAVPVPVSGITNAVAVTAGDDHTCALLDGGTVQCWGDNASGQLGNTSTGRCQVYDACSLTPIPVLGITNAVAVAAGNDHTCAVVGGGVECWGWNRMGELGNGTMGDSSVPVTVSGITNAVAVAAGGDHTCVLLSGGTVQCWGNNASAQLGNSTTATCGSAGPCSLAPVEVSGITNAVAAATGDSHTCALLSNGSVQCWGDNAWGELGNSTTTTCPVPGGNPLPCSLTPVTVSGITNAVAVAAGGNHTCALLSGGSVQCWGDNADGELGDGTTNDSSVPVTVGGF